MIFLCAQGSFCQRIAYDDQFMRRVMQKVDILYEQLILPEIFSQELKNDLLIAEEEKLTINHLLTTVCEQERENNTDLDLLDFEVDFIIGLQIIVGKCLESHLDVSFTNIYYFFKFLSFLVILSSFVMSVKII